MTTNDPVESKPLYTERKLKRHRYGMVTSGTVAAYIATFILVAITMYLVGYKGIGYILEHKHSGYVADFEIKASNVISDSEVKHPGEKIQFHKLLETLKDILRKSSNCSGDKHDDLMMSHSELFKLLNLEEDQIRKESDVRSTENSTDEERRPDIVGILFLDRKSGHKSVIIHDKG